MSATGIGASVRRKEDQRFITGKGHYTDDINRPGQAAIYFIRSPHAHAKIKNIDTAAAAKMPGVAGVFTGEQFAQDKLGNLICGWTVLSKDGSPMKMAPHAALAAGKANHVGDAVAVVIADTLAQAKDAAEKVVVDYEPLPAVVDPAKAAQKGAPLIHDSAPNNTIYNWHIGDPAATDAAFKNAKHVTKLEFINNRLVPNAMEPRAALAEYDSASGHLTLWNATQNPHVARLVIAAFVGMAPEHKLRVIAPDVGGGFGSKIFIYPEEVVCLWAARKLDRPVKWTCERSESFITDAHGRDHVTKAQMAFDGDGKITGLKVHTTANLGAYMSTFSSAVPTFLYATLAVGPVRDPAHLLRGRRGLYQHRAGRRLSRRRPPGSDLRRRAAGRSRRARARHGSRRPAQEEFRQDVPVSDIGGVALRRRRLRRFAAKGAADPRLQRFRQAQARIRAPRQAARHRLCDLYRSLRRGAVFAGRPARRRRGLWESAEVRVNPTGSVELLTGCHQHGQGHETTFAQLVSERLGIPIDNVSVVHGDTDKVQFGMGTYGSRSGAVGMSAIVKALDKVEAKAKKIAAHLLEAADADIEFKDGKFTVAGTDKSAAWGEVALGAYVAHKFPTSEIEPGLKEGAFYDPTNFTFPAGCHICEIEIDPETGNTEIAAWTAVDDFGTVINPMIVEGQVHGGVAQGVGQALLEHTVYDDKGQLVTGSYMDYTMPRADNFPSFKVDTTFTRCPSNPLGIKGCGEAGAIAAPAAVMNAITNALGTEIIDMPATPASVWAVLQRTHKLPHAA